VTDERYEKHIQRIKDEALRSRWGFTEDDFKTMCLDGIKTSSPRIWQLITLAYYRGMMRGVKRVKEGETPITLRMV
jgi:hypothetical protein